MFEIMILYMYILYSIVIDSYRHSPDCRTEKGHARTALSLIPHNIDRRFRPKPNSARGAVWTCASMYTTHCRVKEHARITLDWLGKGYKKAWVCPE